MLVQDTLSGYLHEVPDHFYNGYFGEVPEFAQAPVVLDGLGYPVGLPFLPALAPILSSALPAVSGLLSKLPGVGGLVQGLIGGGASGAPAIPGLPPLPGLPGGPPLPGLPGLPRLPLPAPPGW